MSDYNYKDWPREIQKELNAGDFSPRVGSELVLENERVRVWHLSLRPGERIGFHRHVLDYFWTATSSGRSRSHFADGQIIETDYEAGDTKHYTFAAGEEMVHDLRNIGETTLSFVTVEHKDSANPPQLLS